MRDAKLTNRWRQLDSVVAPRVRTTTPYLACHTGLFRTRCRWSLRGWWLRDRVLRPSQGHAEPERGALSLCARHADLAPVQLDDGAADVQAEAQPDVRASPRPHTRHLIGTLPDVLLLVAGETRSFVAHPDVGHCVGRLQSDLDRAIGWRELEGVAQVVGHHLTQAIRVGDDGNAQPLRERWTDNTSCAGIALLLDNCAHKRREVTGIQEQLQLAL